ncbi:hypothetical protein A0O28_0018140 [Trichoderma guizhouense]|uniref:Cenp-O kinetochore centromere component n=1 Tax=Trichoderma guizhouense TaxID=1491466 RepID=A0A1T3CC68_9HYPO|nr:hypothetical protein A0O28_0018140 [Trichoderma guizhouense]
MDPAVDELQTNPLDEEIASLKKQGKFLASHRVKSLLRIAPHPIPSHRSAITSRNSHSQANTRLDTVAHLRKTIKIECSTILSSPSIKEALVSSLNPQPSPKSAALRPRKPRKSVDRDEQLLLTRSKQQEAYNQQCLYRISASVTAFKVHDPDPNAVDGGHVLGLRFEVMTRGQFLQPYYVMLNRPFPSNSKTLRVHRHTVPPAIPLPGLAARYLPVPKQQIENDSSIAPPKQDLERFVKSLRREIMRYHNRLGVSADLRRSLGAHSQAVADGSSLPSNAIVDVSIADTEAKQIRLTWADERNGRLVMDDDGKVVKFMVFSAEGRDWETTKQLTDSQGRVEDVAKMLEEYAAGRES